MKNQTNRLKEWGKHGRADNFTVSSDRTAMAGKVCLQKSHDEYLRVHDECYEPPLEVCCRQKHLVQVRQPIPSIISEYQWSVTNPEKAPKYHNEFAHGRGSDSRSIEWLPFATRGLQYRSEFLKKWILQNPWMETEQYYFLDYDSFIANSSEKLREVIQFVCPEDYIDDSLIASSLARHPVKPARDSQDFEYASTWDQLDGSWIETWQACRDKLGLDSQMQTAC